MAKSASAPTWKKTSVPNLQRHKSGVYYARLYHGGKQTLKTLDTKTLAVAKRRLHDLKSQMLSAQPRNPSVTTSMTLREGVEIRHDAIDRLRRKPETVKYYHNCLKAFERSWPNLDQPMRRVGIVELEDWAAAFADTMSPTRFNNTIREVKLLFDVGVSGGIIVTNPGLHLKRQPVKPKDLQLPTSDQFQQLLESIESRHGRFSQDCSDMVQFLAYSGCRRGEASFVTWADCDVEAGLLIVRGDPQWATKNGETRRVPLNPSLEALVRRMREERPNEAPITPVLRIQECYKALARACEVIGIPKLTHHDLRHLFATRCIESGVPIPTVSHWLGHKDGGVLAMRIYGHLDQSYSLQQAKKVQF